jgi:hypothetical protein
MEEEVREDVNNARKPQVDPMPELSWPTLEHAALHGVAGEFVNFVAPETEADPVALLAQFIAAFGNSAGKIICRAPDGTRHHMNLFALLCGATAKARKGSSWYWVRRLFEQADPAWTGERVQSGLSSGEGIIWAVRDPVVKREPLRDKGRITGYQDVEVDPGVADKRLLVHEPEFASVLKVLARDGNTLSAIMRQGWDGVPLRALTRNSPVKATGAHVSIIGHITIEELLRYFDSTEAVSGFGNRFLFFCVRRSQTLPRGGCLDDGGLEEIAKRTSDAIAFVQTRGPFEFSEDAYAKWDSIYPKLSAERPGLLGSMLARAEAQVARLAFIYAALDAQTIVGVDHLLAATVLWEYSEASVEFIFGDRMGDPIADAIITALRQRGSMTRTEISNLFGRNLNAAQMERALQLLMRAGMVERQPKGSHSAVVFTTKTTNSTKSA